MQKVDLNDRKTYYASSELLDKLKAIENKGEIIVNFAYTDYGGDFFDKVAIKFFEEKHPESIISEDTFHYGKNAFLFGPVANEFWEETQNYLLGFDGIEDYYSNAESEQEREDFETFLDNCEKYNSLKRSENALDTLCDKKGGYYNITPQGVDYSEKDLIQFCLNEGILIKEETEND